MYIELIIDHEIKITKINEAGRPQTRHDDWERMDIELIIQLIFT